MSGAIQYAINMNHTVYALKALYEATNGSNWKSNTGWDVQQTTGGSSVNPCGDQNLSGDNWMGVQCNWLNGETTNVISLTLQEKNLQGTLPPEFASDPGWLGSGTGTGIDLSMNSISGTLPGQWGKLTGPTRL